MSAPLNAALAWSERGHPVLPVREIREAGGKCRKVPLTKHGLKDATTDADLIRAWWRQWPPALVGVRLDKLLLIDRDAPEAERRWRALVEEHATEPHETARATTPRGHHDYFAANGAKPGKASGKLAQGLEWRCGSGSYAVVPPGPERNWLAPPSEVPPAEAPDWLLGLVNASEHERRAAPAVDREIPEGERNTTLTSLAGSMRRRGMSETAMLAALRTENEQRCRPPLSEDEVERIAASVAQYPSAEDNAPPRTVPAPAAEPVEGAELLAGVELLAEVRSYLTRYVVLPSAEAADLLALWTLHTHTLDAARATPYLRITSATPNSGKTLLLEILATLCARGWHTIGPSPAVLYRMIDRDRPTLLLDEMDNFPLGDRRDALAVLNGGYRRGAKVPRVGERGELQEFECYCPKAYAGLDAGDLPPALLSRSITIRMETKLARESVETWLGAVAEADSDPTPLRKSCAAWADANLEALKRARRPTLPEELQNRSAEVWWALLALAEHVGGDWPARARRAARKLSAGGDEADAMADSVQLLADIRAAFGSERTITTTALLAYLNALDESPWGARRRGEGLDARGLARMLRKFKTPDGAAIRPKVVRVGTETPRGYRADQFADAFERHLPTSATRATSATSHSPSERDVADVADVADTEQGGFGGGGEQLWLADGTPESATEPASEEIDWAEYERLQRVSEEHARLAQEGGQ